MPRLLAPLLFVTVGHLSMIWVVGCICFELHAPRPLFVIPRLTEVSYNANRLSETQISYLTLRTNVLGEAVRYL